MNVRWFLLLVFMAAAGSAAAQTADDLFSLEEVHEVRIVINSRELRQLIANYEQNTYYPADLWWGSVRIRNVAVRVHGRASRVQGKPGFEIDFSRYVARQRFLGLGSLVLDNLWHDATMVREAVSMAVFNRMGVPAPRESFCRLYINNTYYGVYAIVEAVDASFVERRFDDSTGYLFEYHNVAPFKAGYLGDDVEAYKPYFDPRTHRLDADRVLYSPIRDLFREVNQPADAVWRENVERYLDLRQLVTYVAIETFVAEPDGVLGFVGMANFYLHRRADSDQHRLVPWDKDLSFSSPQFPLFLHADENELFRRLLAYDDLMDLYLGTLEECARIASADAWLTTEVERATVLIRDAVYSDERKAWTNDDFEAGVLGLLNFADSRPERVLRDVASVRRAVGRSAAEQR